MDRLPEELKRTVLGYLDVREGVRLNRVCKRFGFPVNAWGNNGHQEKLWKIWRIRDDLYVQVHVTRERVPHQVRLFRTWMDDWLLMLNWDYETPGATTTLSYGDVKLVYELLPYIDNIISTQIS